jgi:hypothetical protein
MISARRGPIPGTASRSGSVIFASFVGQLAHSRVGTIPGGAWLAACWTADAR